MTSSQRSSLTLTHKVVDLVAPPLRFHRGGGLGSPCNWERLRDAALASRGINVVFFAVLLSVGTSGFRRSALRSKRLSSWRHELGDAVKAASLCALVLAALR